MTEGLPPIVFDEPPPLGEGSGPNAAAVLAAAIGNCLAASFAFCLRKVRVEPVDLTAAVVAHVARNEQGRFRISGIDVELAPEVLEERSAAARTMRAAVRGLLHRHRKRAARHSGQRQSRPAGCEREGASHDDDEGRGVSWQGADRVSKRCRSRCRVRARRSSRSPRRRSAAPTYTSCAANIPSSPASCSATSRSA